MHNKKSTKPQKLPFTDEQIRSKAYQISQKYPERSPDENWDAAIKAIKKERLFRPLISIWKWTGIVEKKGWDIFQLAVTTSIPLLLFFGAQYFSTKTNEQQKQAATDKAQQETLVKYLDQMFEAIKTDNLLSNKLENKAFIIAQIRTITTLQSLNPDKQRAIIQFLRTADLLNPTASSRIYAANKKHKTDSHGLFYKALMPAINLNSIDLGGADLRGANLIDANLNGANLSGTYLNGANLSGADLNGADLFDANLSGAHLFDANLNNASLNDADLNRANLFGADLRGATLNSANLNSADLNNANLNNADLTGMRNFSPEEIKLARNWRTATYNGKRLDDPEVSKQLGLDTKP
jgi:uncharacterized protein YjbI with pentapeptide repeats